MVKIRLEKIQVAWIRTRRTPQHGRRGCRCPGVFSLELASPRSHNRESVPTSSSCGRQRKFGCDS